MTVPERTRPLSSIASLIQTAPITRVDRTSRRLVRRRSTFTVGSSYAVKGRILSNFSDLRPFRAASQSPRFRGLYPPHPHPGASHPRGPHRPRPVRHRPDRHRQDGGLRAADPRPPRQEPAAAAAQVLPRRWCSARRASWRCRSPTASAPTAGTCDCRPPSCSAASRSARTSVRSPAASTSWSPRPAACSTSSTGAR